MGKNERGQVGVVVAILMVSLFVAVIVLVQVYYVPNWMKDREAEHMDTVANQFSQIKASIDIETMAQRDISLINSVTLGSKELPFFVSARAFGSLNILSEGSSNFKVSIQGDGLPSEPIIDEKIEYEPYMRSLSSFNLVLGSSLDTGPTGPYWYNATVGVAEINLTVFDVSDVSDSNLLQINLTVVNGSGILVYNQPIAWIPPKSNYSVNLLDDAYKFSTRVLPYLTAPFNLSVDLNNSGGGDFVASGSRYYEPDENIFSTTEMGTIEYSSENAYFVDQTYVYEGGAVVLNQSQGQAVISEPAFSIQNVTVDDEYLHVYSLNLVDVFGLTGKTSVSGYGTYSIKTNYSSMDETEYIASSIYINITTKHASAWQRYMDNILGRSGLSSSEFYVPELPDPPGNSVTVMLNGTDSTESRYDVKLKLYTTTITAQVGPGWVS